MTTTTQLHGYGHYTMTATVEDTVRDFLADLADSYDVDGLTGAYRDAINAELKTLTARRYDGVSIVLRGDDFYADYPAPDDSEDLIKTALGNVDLGALAQQYDES